MSHNLLLKRIIMLINKNLAVIILVEGESFRPNNIEKVVDETISNFIKGIMSYDDEDFIAAKDNTLQQLSEFSPNLPSVAEKFLVNMDEQLLSEDDQTYEEISKSITKNSLYLFAKDFLINRPRRLTIELFANKIESNEMSFKLEADLNLDKRNYEVVTLDYLLDRKQSANHRFKKE